MKVTPSNATNLPTHFWSGGVRVKISGIDLELKRVYAMAYKREWSWEADEIDYFTDCDSDIVEIEGFA